ncbi:hypothetical protein DCG74_02770 [Bradyrhizobium sp. WBAH42]|nr:hypothetical protein [Bradyrhizobium sp. WBAH30]MDD1546250.1 hypothetical protein [Bradyrhizobium sp. WBAH41]MDD1559769.1 hypothetical protein [Bradyrhizobium sp. WBAH23]MDD1567545.1 hypothetical protein [Bradyrhizobium sp. WBAH33]MDD1593179.1 hypothetical protein [Bradyrhizobium sp. WBAH42]NRB90741.1 hypothetical protein [Bradyrhizobium sp. WBAH10]QCJ93758.1 hypothetical protein DAA57_03535 [Bradyrhizobium yuanmingense]
MRLSRDGCELVVSIPVDFRQSGGRKQIVVPAGADAWTSPRSRPSNSIITALAKAHRWRRLIETGCYASAAELSKREAVNESYVCRVLRLTLLAPDLIQAILDGKQPKTVELKTLLKPFPHNWSAQRRHFTSL